MAIRAKEVKTIVNEVAKFKKDEIELSNSSKHIIETIYKEDFLLFYPELLIS